MKNINLDDLFCQVPRSNYSETLIEQLGESIDVVGGLLRPLIVQALVVDECEDDVFEVVDGALFYYAAIYANENNMLLQRVPCWVLAETSDLGLALEQLEYIASVGSEIDDDFALPVWGGV